MKHTHRIVPGHAGGKYEEGNTIELSAFEHGIWHYLRFLETGDMGDYLAALGLSGILGKEEIMAKAMRLGASKSGKKNVESGHLKSIASMGGKVGGRIAKETGQIQAVQPLAAKAGGQQAADCGRLASYNLSNEAKFILISPDGTETLCSGLRPTAKRLGLSVHGLLKCYRGVSHTTSGGYKVKRLQINEL